MEVYCIKGKIMHTWIMSTDNGILYIMETKEHFWLFIFHNRYLAVQSFGHEVGIHDSEACWQTYC